MIHFPSFRGPPVIRCKSHSKFTLPVGYGICSFILIPKSMSSNANWLCPSLNITWYIFHYNWLTKYCSTYDIPDCSIWRSPHIGKVKFFNSIFVRCYCCTLYSYVMFFYSMSGLNGYFIFSGISRSY